MAKGTGRRSSAARTGNAVDAPSQVTGQQARAMLAQIEPVLQADEVGALNKNDFDASGAAVLHHFSDGFFVAAEYTLPVFFFASAILNGDKVSVLDPQRDAGHIDAALNTLGLKALDDNTFQVTLSEPDPAFIWLAAMPASAPVRQDIVKKNGDKWAAAAETLITNGPFKVSEMVPNDHITVVPNSHYWGARPTLTSINFQIVNDGAAALAKYKRGQLDEMAVQPAQAAGVAGDSSLKQDLLKTPDLTVFWITFRVDASLTNNAKLRLAIAQGIDRDAFVAQIFQGQGLPADTFIPKGMHGYAANLSAQKFDVAQARASLAASGMGATPSPPLTSTAVRGPRASSKP